jgi:hypothetical protein
LKELAFFIPIVKDNFKEFLAVEAFQTEAFPKRRT